MSDLECRECDTGKPPVTVEALEAALDGREFLVTRIHSAAGDSMWLATPARPHALAVQLLSAIDMRLTDDPPSPVSPPLDCVVCGATP